MAFGFWQVLSWAAKGWVSRGFPVTLWYSVDAALNIAVKLSAEVEGPAIWLLADIGIAGRIRWVVDEDGKQESRHSLAAQI